jgi:hypothetical protein
LSIALLDRLTHHDHTPETGKNSFRARASSAAPKTQRKNSRFTQNCIAVHIIHAGQPSMKINILTPDIGGTIATDGLTREILSKFPLVLLFANIQE